METLTIGAVGILIVLVVILIAIVLLKGRTGDVPALVKASLRDEMK